VTFFSLIRSYLASIYFLPAQTGYNNLLSTPSDSSYVIVGDLEATGNPLTVEATFNRTKRVSRSSSGYGF
jgi:hypothetical protein